MKDWKEMKRSNRKRLLKKLMKELDVLLDRYNCRGLVYVEMKDDYHYGFSVPFIDDDEPDEKFDSVRYNGIGNSIIEMLSHHQDDADEVRQRILEIVTESLYKKD